MYMPNKTIYVSDQDASLFEEARSLAGETLSSVIARALREFVTRQQSISSGFEEVSLRVGKRYHEKEQRFYGRKMTDWQGFSDDGEWWMQATIYRTQKANWAIFITHVCKSGLLTDKKRWRESGDYLVDAGYSDLLVVSTVMELKDKVPSELFRIVEDLHNQSEDNITYLDI